MAVNKSAITAFLCGLLIPGMGQFMLGRKKRGLCFFCPANIILVSALLVLIAKLYRISQLLPTGTPDRFNHLLSLLKADGLGIIGIMGILYFLLLLIAACDAFFLARK